MKKPPEEAEKSVREERNEGGDKQEGLREVAVKPRKVDARPVRVRNGEALAQAYQADMKFYSALCPRGPLATDRVTFKV